MRLTLEQLKAMDKDQIYERWAASEFPFDSARCRNCITSHTIPDMCRSAEHAEFVKNATELWKRANSGQSNRNEIFLSNIEEFYALRLFYDLFYEQPESQVDPVASKVSQ